MTARKQIVTGMHIVEKATEKSGEVVDIRFTTKTPYYPKHVQVKWDLGTTTWIDVRKINII